MNIPTEAAEESQLSSGDPIIIAVLFSFLSSLSLSEVSC